MTDPDTPEQKLARLELRAALVNDDIDWARRHFVALEESIKKITERQKDLDAEIARLKA